MKLQFLHSGLSLRLGSSVEFHWLQVSWAYSWRKDAPDCWAFWDELFSKFAQLQGAFLQVCSVLVVWGGLQLPSPSCAAKPGCLSLTADTCEAGRKVLHQIGLVSHASSQRDPTGKAESVSTEGDGGRNVVMCQGSNIMSVAPKILG